MPKHMILCLLFGLLVSPRLQESRLFNFVVWNVGQGAWSTFYTQDTCYHFDMGGEKIPWSQILKVCAQKNNEVYITHEDWDHINGLFYFFKKSPRTCLFYPNTQTRKYPKKLRACEKVPSFIQIVSKGVEGHDRNSKSVVYLLRKQVLITGDAPSKEEKKWAHKIPKPVTLLLAGHHGSRTSTSSDLLQRIQPKMSVVSARKMKYGHPHPLVESRLKKQKVPMLRTETFGSLFFKLD